MKLALATTGVVALLALLVTQFTFVVDQTEQALVKRFGAFYQMPASPGLYVKIPFIDEVQKISSRLLWAELTPDVLSTSDGKALKVQAFVVFRIVDPLHFTQNSGSEHEARRQLRSLIWAELSEVVGGNEQGSIIGDGWAELMKEVTHNSAKKAKEFGVEIVEVQLQRLGFTGDSVFQVYDRMRSDQLQRATNSLAQEQEAAALVRAQIDGERTRILAAAERQAVGIMAEAEAEAASIYSEAHKLDQEFAAFIMSLDAYRATFNEKTTLVLSPESQFLQYMNDLSPPDGSE